MSPEVSEVIASMSGTTVAEAPALPPELPPELPKELPPAVEHVEPLVDTPVVAAPEEPAAPPIPVVEPAVETVVEPVVEQVAEPAVEHVAETVEQPAVVPEVVAVPSPVSAAPASQSSQALRQVTSHKVNGLNEKLDIDVLSEPGEGGASQWYRVVNKDTQQVMCDLQFQVGNPNEIGVNGISNEVLLAIVSDRLTGFQSGRFRSDFGDLALNKLNQCIRALRRRTQERASRGVEGTTQR